MINFGQILLRAFTVVNSRPLTLRMRRPVFTDMSQEAILEKVRTIVAEQLSVDAGEVKPESNFQNDLGADSLDTVELVMALEEAFDIEVSNDKYSYRIRGFIDKLFLYKENSYALIRDFKSSKQVFKGKKVTDNMQDLMYSLAVSHLYPEYNNRQSEFLFLKFDLSKDMFNTPGNGVLRMEPISDEELSGFQYELTEYQKKIDNFNEDDAHSHFAGDQGYPSDGSFGGPLMCGKDGYKISRGEPVLDDNGEPIKAYICAFRKPFNYYALINKDGKVLKTSFEDDKEDLIKIQEPDQEIKLMEYHGCPYWMPSEHMDLFD